jgi:ribonuclease HII
VAERADSAELFSFDRGLGAELVAGADEAGRGALAGPIVGAAVLFDQSGLGGVERELLARLGDSKALTKRRRELLFPLIWQLASAVVVSQRSHVSIDARGIEPCNREVLSEPLRRIAASHPQALLLADGLGRGVVDADGSQIRALVKGDATSAAVAAASVVAKVSRDRLMSRAAELQPAYGFERHAGYGTAAHRAAIAEYGPSPWQRLSFGGR